MTAKDLFDGVPEFTAQELPRSPGSVFGGLTIISSSAVPPGCALAFAEPTEDQRREMAGMSVLERAEYMHRKGKATLMRFDPDAGEAGR